MQKQTVDPLPPPFSKSQQGLGGRQRKAWFQFSDTFLEVLEAKNSEEPFSQQLKAF